MFHRRGVAATAGESWFSSRSYDQETPSATLAPYLYALVSGMAVAKVLGRDRSYFATSEAQRRMNVASDVARSRQAKYCCETSRF